jgi:hypothetical protein
MCYRKWNNIALHHRRKQMVQMGCCISGLIVQNHWANNMGNLVSVLWREESCDCRRTREWRLSRYSFLSCAFLETPCLLYTVLLRLLVWNNHNLIGPETHWKTSHFVFISYHLSLPYVSVSACITIWACYFALFVISQARISLFRLFSKNYIVNNCTGRKI